MFADLLTGAGVFISVGLGHFAAGGGESGRLLDK